jgi:tRNA nucleotidyltransferase (CCA-adding enzyme)
MEIITTHLHADFDSLASMVAAHKIYPDAVMVFSGSQERNVREYLAHAELPCEFQRLKNIDMALVSKLIVVDTRQQSRIGNFADCLANDGITIHLYDHHPGAPGDFSGQYERIENVGSTTSIFVEIFQENKIGVTEAEATLMAMAIHEDTGSFTFDTTTARDLEALAWLLRQGAQLSPIAQFISMELSAKDLGILNEMINTASTYTIHGVDLVIARIMVPEYIDEFALLVRKFMVIENLNALFALASMGERVYLIARSRVPEVNAGKIAMEFGGGGHASAASSTVKDMTLIEAEEKLLGFLHKYVKPVRLAKDLMSSPVISVGPNITIEQANNELTRYSITVLPVLKQKKTLLGIISRRVIEKAIYHGLGNCPVSDYMSTEFITLKPSSTLAEIQEVIIENRQRFIPVIEQELIAGVITRTDLLSVLVDDSSISPGPLNKTSGPSIERNRNVNSLMINSLSREMIRLLRCIGEVAEEHNYVAYAVGGFVRDLLRHTSNMDLDIVIEGDGIDFARHLTKKLGGTMRAHEKFHTAVVKFDLAELGKTFYENTTRDLSRQLSRETRKAPLLPPASMGEFRIDVATARLEYYEYPAAMPSVELSSIKLDLYRRDFTINALAIHLSSDKFGILVDFFNCQNDIRDQQIRVLHNLSFVEDPTRIFRAIRFEQRLGFQLGKLTERLMKKAIKMDMYGRFAGRRFFHELQWILSEENPLPAIYRMDKFKLLTFLDPGIRLDQRLKDILRETHRSISWYKLLYLDEPFSQWQVFLMALTVKLSTKKMMGFCEKFDVPERYKISQIRNKIAISKIERVLRKRPMDGGTLADRPVGPAGDRILGPPLKPSEVYWLLKGLSTEALLCLMGITEETSGKKAVSLYVTHLRTVKTFLHGNDLKKMGYKQGPIYAKILNHLLEAKLDGIVSSRQDEEAFLRKQYPINTTAEK